MNKQDNVNFDEMLIHPALCTHPDVQKILLIGSQHLQSEIDKHYPGIEIKHLENSDAITTIENNAFDIVISQLTVSASEVYRVLNEKGLATIASKSYWEDVGILRKELFEFSEEFHICMPYKVEGYVILQMRGNIFASKKYHPTADMILHKIDLLDGLVYYDSENHLASFVLPKSINKELLPIMKK